MPYSPLIALGLALRKRADEEYRDYAEAYLVRAQAECGHLVDRRGAFKGLTERDLLVGSSSTHYRRAYATEEFRAYLLTHPYKTIRDFEQSHARQYAALLGVSL